MSSCKFRVVLKNIRCTLFEIKEEKLDKIQYTGRGLTGDATNFPNCLQKVTKVETAAAILSIWDCYVVAWTLLPNGLLSTE